MKPTAFPTQHILFVAAFSMLAYMLLFLLYSSYKKKDALRPLLPSEDRKSRFLIAWLLFAAFAVRIALSCMVVGHKTDINCFTVWGNNLSTSGFTGFYNVATNMPDYPPGYMYILGLMSTVSKALGHGIYDAAGDYDLVYVAFIKLPSILADLAAAYVIYRLAKRKFRFEPSLILMAIVAFSPIMMYISAGWGQIDQILAVLLVLSMLSIYSRRPILAGAIYAFAILMKPQALMLGPLMALAYGCYVFDPNFFALSKKKEADKMSVRIAKTVAAVAIACAIIIVSALPFHSAELPWYQLIIQKYLGTATSYEYATVNAYNIYALFGRNWTQIDTKSLIGLTYGQLGTIGMVVSVAFGGVMYMLGRKKNNGALSLAAAFTLASLFTIGHYMHERYLFPMLLLLLVAYIYYGDRWLLYTFFAYSLTMMINCHAAFYYAEYFKYQLYWDTRIVFWCSLANVLIFVLFALICVKNMILGRPAKDVFAEEKQAAAISE